MKRKNKNIIEGLKLNYNAAQQERYKKALRQLVKKMVDTVKPKIIKLFEGATAKTYYKEQKVSAMDASITSEARILTNKLTEQFNSIFNRQSKIIAEAMVLGANKASITTLSSSIKKLSSALTLNPKKIPGPMREMMKAVVEENVSLIKSIGNEYLGNVQKSVMRSITNGGGVDRITEDLQKYEGISFRKAKNIALDQTRKAYNSINKGRMETIGLTHFMWLHSGGGAHPRPLHQSYDGEIFAFDDLPVIEEATGETGIPGQAINCGCTMKPVIDFSDDEDEE